jgi:multicomponent Na+:H+ antiporter subunit C
MSPFELYAAAGVALTAIALFGLFAARHPVRRLIAGNLMGSGVFLVFVALARRTPGPTPDPVQHALVLTGIVVSVSATALALALLRRSGGATGEALKR